MPAHLEDSILIEEALTIYRTKKEIHFPEVARTMFLKPMLLARTEDEIGAAAAFKEAKTLKNSIAGAPKIADAKLGEENFDELVMFLSR